MNIGGRPQTSFRKTSAQQTFRESLWTPANVSAEGVGFEPTEAQKTSTVFETVPFVRSGSLPASRLA
jgi:hypothetical protein